MSNFDQNLPVFEKITKQMFFATFFVQNGLKFEKKI